MALTQVFISISSLRSARHTRHDLADLLTVAVCAVLSGADDFVDIELWAEAKIDWLRGFMKIEHGLPPHDTIGRVLAMIAPDEFESALRRWVGMVASALAGDTVVAINGKTRRHSDGKTSPGPLRLVSTFAAGMGASCWGRRQPPGSPTKSPRFPNHPNLYGSILFAGIDPRGPLTPSSTHETTTNDHGRIEVRRCRAYAATDRLYKSEDWQDLAVMNLLRLNTTRKARIKSRRMLAATIDKFRTELPGVMT